MELFIQLILGMAHAMLFGLFAIAAVGKLSVCRGTGQAMCIKGGVDVGLAILAALITYHQVARVVGVFAVAISMGGWLREWKTRNSICNCFGVLTAPLHSWRNYSRALLFSGGLLILSLDSVQKSSRTHLLVGIIIGLAALLVLSALAFARASKAQPLQRKNADAVPPLASDVISAKTFLGKNGDGKEILLGDLPKFGEPLLMLLISPSCKACQELKNRIGPSLSSLPWPLITIVESDILENDSTLLFDKKGQLRSKFGIKTLPSMVVLNKDRTNLQYPAATGSFDILTLLLHVAVSKPKSCTRMHEESILISK